MSTPISVLLKDRAVVSVTPTTTIFDAVLLMTQQQVGCIAVMEGARLVGIFTERDVMTRVVARKVAPETGLVGDVMTKDPDTVPPEATIQQVMELFNTKRFRHIPIVSGGQLLGLISIRDISDWLVAAHRAEADQLMQYITGYQQVG